MPDLNATVLTGEVCKLPDYSRPWSYVELRVSQPDGGVMFLSLHVPTARWLQTLEDLSPGDRLYAAGELAYARSDRLEGRGGPKLVIITFTPVGNEAGSPGARGRPYTASQLR
jgi:hypothetical protein